MFNYSLDNYTWKSSLLWGNFAGHLNKAWQGDLKGRIIHVLIAAIELLPIISQISSVFEMIIVNKFRVNHQNPVDLEEKKFTNITEDVKNSDFVPTQPEIIPERTPEIIPERTPEPQEEPPAPDVIPDRAPSPVIDTASKVDDVAEPVITVPEPFSWADIAQHRVPCGSKHDQLVQLEMSAKVPKFFGFSHGQIQGLFSEETKRLWGELQTAENPFTTPQLFEDLQKSVEQDILALSVPFENWQSGAFNDFKDTNTTLIVRSSSNEDGQVVNAGGNDTIAGVAPTEDNLKAALAKVVCSYFSMKSLKNRAAFENPFKELPLCSVLIMEQIVETPEDVLPIVSGVMMTNELGWSSPGEDGILHITASWGFANGTNNKTVCDEWAITDDHHYATVRRKFNRNVPEQLGTEKKIANSQDLRERPCLTDNQLTQLKTMAKQLESSFGKPLNVEFVIKGKELYIVQARPIQTAPLSSNTSYLDPVKIPSEVNVFKGNMIISGPLEVVALEKSQIIFAKDLKEAEKFERPKVVVVYMDESSTTHSAVNFASNPSVPCLVLPYNKWLECKNSSQSNYLLCTQSGSLVEAHPELSVQTGLFMHPARFALSMPSGGYSMQQKSSHPSIIELQNLLTTTAEVLKGRLKEIQDKLDETFDEISARMATKSNKLSTVVAGLQSYSKSIMQKMEMAADKNQMTQLAFHAGMLRQLVGQNTRNVMGAHSISGLEAATNLPASIEEFITLHSEQSFLCDMALFALHGFDEPIQRKWLAFLEANKDSNFLETLNVELEVVIGLDLASNWLSEHFSDSTLPAIERLITKIKNENKINLGLVDVKAEIEEISDLLSRIDSKQALELVWNKIEACGATFIDYCSKNNCKHPLILELIDLWDLSTKAVTTSHLFEDMEEKKQHDRLDALTHFATVISNKNLLNYSLEGLIREIPYSGSSDNKFSLQQWLLPLSNGYVGKIKTADERLTVLHQNLLQAAAVNSNPKQLPAQLALAYRHIGKKPKAKRFGRDCQDHFFIGRDRATARINIPLNFHSTVVNLSQKKGCAEIEVTVYIRASDNYRGHHLNFFKIFAEIAEIQLIPSDVDYTSKKDLKVVFSVEDEEKMKVLGDAIYYLNENTVYGAYNEFRILNYVVDDENDEDKVVKFMWKKLELTNKLPRGFRDSGVIKSIWNFLESNNELEKLTSRVVDELEGKRPESHFSKLFTEMVLEDLPAEVSKKLYWGKLINCKKIIFPSDIPEEISSELLVKLFNEHPKQASRYIYFCDELFIKLMDERLDDTTRTWTTDEAKFLVKLADNYRGSIPDKWKGKLLDLIPQIKANAKKRYWWIRSVEEKLGQN